MIRGALGRLGFLLLISGLCYGCQPSNSETAEGVAAFDSVAQPVGSEAVLPDSLALNEAVRTLDVFLRFSVEDYEPKDQHIFDTLWACWGDQHPVHRRWLADYRVLDAEPTAPDTVTVAAEVVTVADQTESTTRANAFVVTPRLRVDTLHWLVIHSADENRMVICGFSSEGVDFGSFGLPSNTSYEDGASKESLLARIDSIQGARYR